MDPPPSTPSPRRFMSKPAKSSQKRHSNLRFTAGDGFDPPDNTIDPQRPSRQFTPAPRFSRPRDLSPDADLFHKSTESRRRELIVDPERKPKDASQGHDTESDEDTSLHNTETAEERAFQTRGSSKGPLRRSEPRFRDPQLAPSVSVQSQVTPRRFMFSLAAPSPTSPAPTDSSAVPARPVFLKPPVPAQEAPEPLPEAFSPHRRGEKFVAGGMAAEVRQWVMDVGHYLPPSSSSRSTGARGDELIVRVVEAIGSVKEGVILARAQFEGRVLKLLLPTAGKNKREDAASVGDLLALKAPSWDVEIAGDTWVVGVDWRIASG